MSDKPVRLHVGCRDGSSFWTEPLGFVDAKVLAQMLAACGMAVAWHLNNRSVHRQVEAIFAAAPQRIASMKWMVGCGCEQCGNQPSECRIVRIAPPASCCESIEVKIEVLPAAAQSTGPSSLSPGCCPLAPESLGEPVLPAPAQPGVYSKWVDSLLALIVKGFGLPESFLPGKDAGHAS